MTWGGFFISSLPKLTKLNVPLNGLFPALSAPHQNRQIGGRCFWTVRECPGMRLPWRDQNGSLFLSWSYQQRRAIWIGFINLPAYKRVINIGQRHQSAGLIGISFPLRPSGYPEPSHFSWWEQAISSAMVRNDILPNLRTEAWIRLRPLVAVLDNFKLLLRQCAGLSKMLSGIPTLPMSCRGADLYNISMFWSLRNFWTSFLMLNALRKQMNTFACAWYGSSVSWWRCSVRLARLSMVISWVSRSSRIPERTFFSPTLSRLEKCRYRQAPQWEMPWRIKNLCDKKICCVEKTINQLQRASLKKQKAAFL